MYDLIIIGAGPAGLSAAVYATRKKLNLLVLTNDVGGQTTEAHTVDNYLGIPGLLGVELVEKFREHAKKLKVEIKESIAVEKIVPTDGNFAVKTNQGDWEAKAIIITTGKRYRKLEIPGAAEFEGKGITYCASCDAPLYAGKTVAVVGAGDAGQDAAWQLTKYAKKIYLLNRYPELRGDDKQIQEQIKNHPKIEIINECYPVEVKGDKFVKGLIYQRNGSDQKREIAAEGIFVEIGSVPASKFLKDVVKLNERGEIVIDLKTNASSVPGIFAAGDVTDVTHKQMIVAAGEGAKAALAAYEHLKNK
ncbi:MAG: alkyl hydroperoxide reductase subunit F [Parcubacteria group bacterium LiPW_39]|nr:MAG: alkyl hydroperoxide reductase subunit F [Parcubacteria group bacterium LiPW_39]